jgi:Domain of unknown function (DUF5122) beta-propeller/NHL repeat
MALGTITVSSVRFDNEPFVRSLTATILPGSDSGTVFGTETVVWVYGGDVWAKTRSGDSYTPETTGTYTALSTMFFYISTETYDFRVAPYSLYEQTISAAYLVPGPTVESSDDIQVVYDNFPAIQPPVLFVNNENTNESDKFYREIVPQYNFNLSAFVDQSLVNPTNYILSSENFNSWTVQKNITAVKETILAPDGKSFATTLTPLSTTISNSISSIINLTNTLSTTPHIPGTYTVASTGYTVFGNGREAIFNIGVTSFSAVSSIDIVDGGNNFRVGDFITISNTSFGQDDELFPISFEVGSIINTNYELGQSLYLDPDTYTYSVFAFPLSGQYIYLRGFGQGNIIYDIEQGLAYQNGAWQAGEVDFVNVELFNPSLTIFNTFGTAFNGAVRTVLPSADRIFVGGDFTAYNGVSANYIICLDGTGNIVNTFNPSGSGFNARVRTIVPSVDGTNIFVGGDFTSYSATSAERIVCLNGSTGAVVPAFNSSPGFRNGVVTTIAPSGTNLFVGGTFTNYKGVTNNRIICIRGENGAANTTFVITGTNGFNSTVRAIAVEPTSERIYVGGDFTAFKTITTKVQRIICLNKIGNQITSFLPSTSAFDNSVFALQLDSSNRPVVGGSFTDYNRTNRRGIARLTTTGAVDTTFNPGDGFIYQTGSPTNATVTTLAIDSTTSNIYAGGSFSYYNNQPGNVGIINLTPTGAKNTDFNNSNIYNAATPDNLTLGIALSGDYVFLGGAFQSFRGRNIVGLAQLNSSGILPTIPDTRFQNWRRCTAAFTLTSGSIYDAFIGITTDTTSISSAVNGSESVLIWGSQINRGRISSLTPYISTLNIPRTTKYNDTFIRFNNNNTIAATVPLTSTGYSALCSFNTQTKTICSVNITLSANSTFDSLRPWYTPHTVTNTISGVFLQKMLTADFVGFPTNYFDTFGRQVTGLDFVTEVYTTSPGLCFYGEGHTETIKLSAKNSPAIANFYWTVGNNNVGFYDISAIEAANGLFGVAISSSIGVYPTYPITLLISDGTILSSGPFFYFDDVTGERLPYPFYYNTENNPKNTKLRDSIKVSSFETPASAFNLGISGNNNFLPANGTPELFDAFLRVSLSGFQAETLDPCYDKYNLVWRWSTFTGCTANPTSFNGLPSSWSTVQCLYSAGALPSLTGTPLTADPGLFPKTWRPEGSTTLSAERSPVFCYGSNVIWTLSTQNWEVNQSNPGNVTDYTYPLQYLNDGTLPTTVSINKDTPVLIRGEQTVTCTISSPPFDWGLKEYVVAEQQVAVVLSRGNFSLYTPNKYVLTGTEIIFENLSVGFNNVSQIVINLGESNTVVLTPENVYSNFSATYNTVGPKTVTVTTFYNASASLTPAVDVFTNVVEVLPHYDHIEPENYLTEQTSLNIPYPSIPLIAPNEWAVEDNINSVFRKFYENLEYLETRSNMYEYTPTEYIGWLGTIPTSVDEGVLSRCPLWTWEDLDCQVGGQDVPWEDTEIVDDNFPTITTTGPLASCGTWQQHECDLNIVNPDCYGKYGIEWKWKSRKAIASTKLITWKSTRCDQSYARKWSFEPWVTPDNETITSIPCVVGDWHVGTSKLNQYKEPIVNCTPLERCSYNNITTRNNILYVALQREIKVFSANRTPRQITSRRLIDDIFSFENIKSIALDSTNKLYVLDGTLNKVASYTVDINQPIPFEAYLSWGGFGGRRSNFKFSRPNDLHIDADDNIWITDTGNNCIKKYSNSGSWLQTLISDNFIDNAPISTCIDSQKNIHVLTESGEIFVFTDREEFVFKYNPLENTSLTPTKITTNYNREVIYVSTNTQVLKYFRTGTFFGFLTNNQTCVTNINSVYQDEYRNTLIAAGDKIVKYVDLMTTKNIKGNLPSDYRPLTDLLIHKDEYIQNWVYIKSFHRLWDNIEMFRHSLIFDESNICKKYIPPVYSKEQRVIGQNEIVTSSVINRNIRYLWENFTTLLAYFDPKCVQATEEVLLQQIEATQTITTTT